MQQHHTFSIEQTINPVTGEPFGQKYGGSFQVRRPSIADRRNIALKEAAIRNTFGTVNPGQVTPGLDFVTYIEIYVNTVSEQQPPAWFNLATMFDESDEAAMGAVWDEVQKFVDSFRSGKAGGPGAGGGE